MDRETERACWGLNGLRKAQNREAFLMQWSEYARKNKKYKVLVAAQGLSLEEAHHYFMVTGVWSNMILVLYIWLHRLHCHLPLKFSIIFMSIFLPFWIPKQHIFYILCMIIISIISYYCLLNCYKNSIILFTLVYLVNQYFQKINNQDFFHRPEVDCNNSWLFFHSN